MKSPYRQLNLESTCTPDLLSLKDDSKFIKVYGENYVYPLSASHLAKDEPILRVIEKFEIDIVKKITIFRLDPYTCYNWHTDGIRSCAINMQLTAFGDSLTMFGERHHNAMMYTNTTELKYLPNRYFLFNTGIPHIIHNFSQTRYLLSLGIPKKFTYEEVEEFIIRNNI